MKTDLVYSLLLVAGLVGSQLVPAVAGEAVSAVQKAIQVATMICLACSATVARRACGSAWR